MFSKFDAFFFNMGNKISRYVTEISGLIHWGQDKMAEILPTTFWITFFKNKNGWISIQISLKFVFDEPIDNKPSLVQIMAWCRTASEWVSD